MSMAQHQQLNELLKKARLIKSKKIPESSRALQARMAVLEAKTYLKMKGQKLVAKIIQSLAERKVRPDIAVQVLDC